MPDDDWMTRRLHRRAALCLCSYAAAQVRAGRDGRIVEPAKIRRSCRRTTRARSGGVWVALAVSGVSGLGCKTVADEETLLPYEEGPEGETPRGPGPERSPADGGLVGMQMDGAVTRADAGPDA